MTGPTRVRGAVGVLLTAIAVPIAVGPFLGDSTAMVAVGVLVLVAVMAVAAVLVRGTAPVVGDWPTVGGHVVLDGQPAVVRSLGEDISGAAVAEIQRPGDRDTEWVHVTDLDRAS